MLFICQDFEKKRIIYGKEDLFFTVHHLRGLGKDFKGHSIQPSVFSTRSIQFCGQIIHSQICISRKLWRDLERKRKTRPFFGRAGQQPHVACSSFGAPQEQGQGQSRSVNVSQCPISVDNSKFETSPTQFDYWKPLCPCPLRPRDRSGGTVPALCKNSLATKTRMIPA